METGNCSNPAGNIGIAGVIAQGQSSNFAEDYHQRELRILKDGAPVVIVPYQQLKPGMTVADPALPWTLKINVYCYNCEITRRPETLQEHWTEPGKFMQLKPARALNVDRDQRQFGLDRGALWRCEYGGRHF